MWPPHLWELKRMRSSCTSAITGSEASCYEPSDTAVSNEPQHHRDIWNTPRSKTSMQVVSSLHCRRRGLYTYGRRSLLTPCHWLTQAARTVLYRRPIMHHWDFREVPWSKLGGVWRQRRSHCKMGYQIFDCKNYWWLWLILSNAGPGPYMLIFGE